jgi:hypothetical protein
VAGTTTQVIEGLRLQPTGPRQTREFERIQLVLQVTFPDRRTKERCEECDITTVQRRADRSKRSTKVSATTRSERPSGNGHALCNDGAAERAKRSERSGKRDSANAKRQSPGREAHATAPSSYIPHNLTRSALAATEAVRGNLRNPAAFRRNAAGLENRSRRLAATVRRLAPETRRTTP